MKRRDLIRATGAATALGVTTISTASARPNCDYCEFFDAHECPDECDHIGCDPCEYDI